MANKYNKKIKRCKVLNYIDSTKTIIIDFDGFGISFNSDVKYDFVDIKYSGNIGDKNFICELVR